MGQIEDRCWKKNFKSGIIVANFLEVLVDDEETTLTQLNKNVSLQGILSIPTHAFATCVQINHFCDFKSNCPPWHLVKTIGSHVNDHKVVCSCICNLYLQLMSIWKKMNMKNIFISSIFSGIPK
jgi:hypothetical protein